MMGGLYFLFLIVLIFPLIFILWLFKISLVGKVFILNKKINLFKINKINKQKIEEIIESKAVFNYFFLYLDFLINLLWIYLFHKAGAKEIPTIAIMSFISNIITVIIILFFDAYINEIVNEHELYDEKNDTTYKNWNFNKAQILEVFNNLKNIEFVNDDKMELIKINTPQSPQYIYAKNLEQSFHILLLKYGKYKEKWNINDIRVNDNLMEFFILLENNEEKLVKITKYIEV